MAKATERWGTLLGRRLVEADVLTQKQVNDCLSAAIHVRADSLPELELHMVLDPAVFSRLMNGHDDG